MPEDFPDTGQLYPDPTSPETDPRLAAAAEILNDYKIVGATADTPRGLLTTDEVAAQERVNLALEGAGDEGDPVAAVREEIASALYLFGWFDERAPGPKMALTEAEHNLLVRLRERIEPAQWTGSELLPLRRLRNEAAAYAKEHQPKVM